MSAGALSAGHLLRVICGHRCAIQLMSALPPKADTILQPAGAALCHKRTSASAIGGLLGGAYLKKFT